MSRMIIDFNPSDDLEHSLPMLIRLVTAGQLGEYSSEPFRDWLAAALKGCGVTSFADIGKSDPERELKVVISDISRGQMRLLPDSLSDAEKTGFSVAEAVRLSMSIPLFFAPGQFGSDVIVDGGILTNYPVWIYDAQEPERSAAVADLRLRALQLPGRTSQSRSTPPPDILKAMFQTMMHAHDKHNLATTKITRTINVDITNSGVTVTQFSLSNDQKDDLYRRGYQCTKDYLLRLSCRICG